jgi:glycosyltransferase involved in cell wall biosynthesis
MNDLQKPHITFIIPTIGRSTLHNSLESIYNQTISTWKAIIIFDGVKSTLDHNDNRIQIIEIPKSGMSFNSAGLVRNEGMKYVNTQWIAFLDDDDTISSDYLTKFYEDLDNIGIDQLDVYIYRMAMIDTNCNKIRIVPKADSDNFYICDVGISFIIKKEIFDKNIIFTPDGAEDYLYLNKIREKGYKIWISKYVSYFVRMNPFKVKNINLLNYCYIYLKNLKGL